MNKRNEKHEREDVLAASIEAGMKFQVIEKNMLGKKELQEGGIEVIGVKNFKFKKDDILVVDEVDEKTVSFHVVRSEKNKKHDGEVIRFVFSKIIFIQRFESFTDLDNVIDNVTGFVAKKVGQSLSSR